MMESVWLDIQHAARTLRASPLFTTVAVLSLAIGIAGTTIIFGITDAYLFRPRPEIADAGQVVQVGRKVTAARIRSPQLPFSARSRIRIIGTTSSDRLSSPSWRHPVRASRSVSASMDAPPALRVRIRLPTFLSARRAYGTRSRVSATGGITDESVGRRRHQRQTLADAGRCRSRRHWQNDTVEWSTIYGDWRHGCGFQWSQHRPRQPLGTAHRLPRRTISNASNDAASSG